MVEVKSGISGEIAAVAVPPHAHEEKPRHIKVRVPATIGIGTILGGVAGLLGGLGAVVAFCLLYFAAGKDLDSLTTEVGTLRDNVAQHEAGDAADKASTAALAGSFSEFVIQYKADRLEDLKERAADHDNITRIAAKLGVPTRGDP